MFEKLEKDIGYTFKDQKLLKLAMTHPSCAGETHVHNQRLEFLGDAVLQLCMSDRLYHQYPDLQEGKLSKLRARCVQEGALEVAARKLNLGKYLLLGHGEEKVGGREKPSILADAFEAMLASRQACRSSRRRPPCSESAPSSPRRRCGGGRRPR